jgi:four helix bundle protein
LEIALKEGRETRYWLRLLTKSEIIPEQRIKGLLSEIEEINKILAAIIIKTKKKNQ